MTIELSLNPFHDGGRYHIETSPLICRGNQWTGFYMMTAFFMKGLNSFQNIGEISHYSQQDN